MDNFELGTYYVHFEIMDGHQLMSGQAAINT